MHYYQHNIADYRKDTAHLSLLEHGIYRQLLDTYYLDEEPLTNDLAKLMRSHSVRNADEQQSLQNVLTDFFELTENGYIHKRCNATIAEFHGKSEKARQSAMVRWANRDKGSKRTHKKRNANALQTHTEGTANGMLTSNQKPVKREIELPSFLSQEMWDEWLQHRKVLKKPMSDLAMAKFINQLTNFVEQGHDVKKMIDNAIANGWQTVYPKDDTKVTKSKANLAPEWRVG